MVEIRGVGPIIEGRKMTSTVSTPSDPVENLAIGTVLEVDGTHIIAELESGISELTRVHGGIIYPIGQFGSVIKIHFGRTQIFGYVSRLRMKAEYDRERGVVPSEADSERIVEADLFGEGRWIKDSENESLWILTFDRGVSTFPLPQQRVYLTERSELKHIFGQGGSAALYLGEHVGSGGTPAYADMNELLGKHTAVLGSTGAGKSGAVAALVHSIISRGQEQKIEPWNPRIVILDPHNEYGDAFKGCNRIATDEDTLALPYWLLNLDETVALLIGKTEWAATSQTNIVKNALLKARRESAEKLGIDADEITVDSPIPYELGMTDDLNEFGKKGGVSDYFVGFVGGVNKQRPANSNKKDHEDFNKVLRKLDTLKKDARLSFMMRNWSGEADELASVMGQFFRAGHPVTVVDLSGVPNEVAGAASSAIARLLFSVKLWQTNAERKRSPILMICEEAHRYVPDKGEAQYAAAQEAIQRLAKEGRKYGIGLMLVSQRPSEVDATVLSQCNSWLVLRVTNEKDRDHVRAVLPDSLAGLTKVLSGLRRREAIFVGQATLLPSRILIRKLAEAQLPRSHDIDFDKGWQNDPLDEQELADISRRWRLQRREASESSRNGRGLATEETVATEDDKELLF